MPVGLEMMLPVPRVLVRKPEDAHFVLGFLVLVSVPLLYGAELMLGTAVLIGESPVLDAPAPAVCNCGK